MHCFFILVVIFKMPCKIFKTKSSVTKFPHGSFSYSSTFKSFLGLYHVDISKNLKSKLFELNKCSKCSSKSKKKFQTVWKLSRQYRNLLDNKNNFPDNPEMFQTIQKLSRQYGNLPDNTETFQTVKQLSGKSGNVQDNPENFQTI